MLPQQPQLTLYTDSSDIMWGAHLGNQMVSEYWSRLNVLKHINEKELQAVLLALTHFRLQLQNKTVMICTDSMVALHYIRKQGGTRSEGLIPLALQLWDLAIRNNIQLLVRHVPGKENVIADHLSRLHGI